ncbi:hypothetical protein OIU77_012278 [Salix suchowensis]|uniref:Galectin domain-containing protein n=1 Tax=Salix suchowensis TaxID=1278906 RepID=A0ABQ9A3W8_9ROSI|nr:hypothetical protein OIU77_012278 [Salix suchowensis]
MQWPVSYCDTKQSCCYPRTGKPVADFGIHGLWPQNKDGSYPQNCNPDSALDEDQISDLTSSLQKDWASLSCPSSTGFRFWSHEWEKHGTCAESEEIDQHGYFEAALKLKEKANLLQALRNAGIQPDDEFYDLGSIKEAIKDATGFTPGIECNIDPSKNSQIYQVFMCVDISGSEFIECPAVPKRRCASKALSNGVEAIKEAGNAWNSLIASIEEERLGYTNESSNKRVKEKQCPHFLDKMNATEHDNSGYKLWFPCGLTQGSSVTIISIPDGLLGNFQIDLTGEAPPGEPDPPIIFHYSVRLHGDKITEDPVIAVGISFCIPVLDELDQCNKTVGRNDTRVTSMHSDGSRRSSFQEGTKLRRYFPFKQATALLLLPGSLGALEFAPLSLDIDDNIIRRKRGKQRENCC